MSLKTKANPGPKPKYPGSTPTERKAEGWKARLARNRGYVNVFRQSCIICGEDEVCTLDMHHVVPEEKSIKIGTPKGVSVLATTSECIKCVCLCANCHRKHHAGVIDISDSIPSDGFQVMAHWPSGYRSPEQAISVFKDCPSTWKFTFPFNS